MIWLMNKILHKTELAPKIFEIVVAAPRIAKKALPGHFVVVMADERGERIPLTIADFDRQAGTITLVLMVVGTSSLKLSQLQAGDSLYALIGPLGKASEIEDFGTVVLVAGGVGTAPVYPIARAFHQRGCRVITIQGARSDAAVVLDGPPGCRQRSAHHHHRRRLCRTQRAGDRAAAGIAGRRGTDVPSAACMPLARR